LKLFALMAGEDHHCHAEHGGPGPEPMVLHTLTSRTESVTHRSFIFIITQFLKKVKSEQVEIRNTSAVTVFVASAVNSPVTAVIKKMK
jgi:hypothetical protein